MKEYIERKAAEQAKPEFLNEKVEDYEKAIYAKGWNDCNAQYRENILSIPTSDVVEVVRCGKCMHRDEITGWCDDVQDYISNTNWFCAGGERKDGADDG